MGDLTLFDYNGLSIETANSSRAAAERIRTRLNRTVEDIVAIGLDLIQQKDRLPHGSFLPWITSEFKMGEQTARNFINVGKLYGSKSPIIGDLNPTVLYELASPSTSDEVRKVVEERASSGETVSVAEVKKLKKEALEAKEQAQQSGEEVDKLRTENKMLIDGADAARLQAQRDAKLEVEESIKKLETEIEDIQKRHEQEVIDLASTKTKEQMDAQSDEIKRLNRLKKEKEEAIEALERSSSRIDQNIAEKKLLAERMASFEFEVGETMKEAEEILRNMALFMNTLDAVDFEQVRLPTKVQSTLKTLSEKSGKLSQTIDTLFIPKLKVVEIEGEVITA